MTEMHVDTRHIDKLINDRIAAYQGRENQTKRTAANVVRRAIRAEAKKIRGAGTIVGYTKKGRAKVRHKLETSVQIRRDGDSYHVGPRTPLAHLVIRGHRPPSGLIMPKAVKALSWAGSGGQIFAASSPGGDAHANPFVHRAYDELTRQEAVNSAASVLFHGGPEDTGD